MDSEAYEDRNLLAMAMACIAPYDCSWVVTDPGEPDWPVVVIDLRGMMRAPSQITYHVPKGTEGLTRLHHCDPDQDCWSRHKWDGHSTEEKRDRIRRLIGGG